MAIRSTTKAVIGAVWTAFTGIVAFLGGDQMQYTHASRERCEQIVCLAEVSDSTSFPEFQGDKKLQVDKKCGGAMIDTTVLNNITASQARSKIKALTDVMGSKPGSPVSTAVDNYLKLNDSGNRTVDDLVSSRKKLSQACRAQFNDIVGVVSVLVGRW